jgi:hypothetical protein
VLTASQLVGMTDNEMATYASGGYGPAKRTEMIALIRRLALAETQKGGGLFTPRKHLFDGKLVESHNG